MFRQLLPALLLFAFLPVRPAGTQEMMVQDRTRFLNTVYERIKTKFAEEETKDRAQQSTREQQELEERQRIERVISEKTMAEQLARDSASTIVVCRELPVAFPCMRKWNRKKEEAELEARSKATEEKEIRAALKTAHQERLREEEKARERSRQRATVEATLRNKLDEWLMKPSDDRYKELRILMANLAQENETICKVTIVSEDSNSNETKGATIRYQTLEQRQFKDIPRTAQSPTACVEKMTPNEYYIWSERQGKKTSDDNYRTRIANEAEQVKIKEDK